MDLVLVAVLLAVIDFPLDLPWYVKAMHGVLVCAAYAMGCVAGAKYMLRKAKGHVNAAIEGCKEILKANGVSVK